MINQLRQYCKNELQKESVDISNGPKANATDSNETKTQLFLPFSGEKGIQLFSKMKKHPIKRENIHYIKEILFDSRNDETLSICSRFIGTINKWIVYLWCIVVESKQIYCFWYFLVQNFNCLCKILIIKAISNEKRNELTIYAKLCWNVTIFSRQELSSLFQLQEKLKACGDWK